MNKKCQVFTPRDYVEKLLDSIDYKHDLYGKKVLENSCGDGNVLSVIVKRYIDDCKIVGMSHEEIKCGLERDIVGIEIDKNQVEKCLEKIGKIAEDNDIYGVKWKIINKDYLKIRDVGTFDYVIGNPPYITYSELRKKEREYLKKKYSSCKKGKFDYCYAFLEKSIESLSSTGKMAYLIPSSVFKTVYGKTIRELMHPLVTEIIDYTHEKLFKEALVKSSIIVLKKENDKRCLHYVDTTIGKELYIEKHKLGDKWFFDEVHVGKKRFGDYFKVSHVVATLCNKAFIVKKWTEDDNGNIVCGGYFIEGEIVREAISPKNRRNNHKEKIIFPYGYNKKHKLIRYSEHDFKIKFPGAYRYLKQYKDILKKRKSDKSVLWFEYGRSQALQNLDCEKALISTVISSEVCVYKLNQSSVPYAGMYFIPISNKLSIDDGIAILKEKSFLKYVRNVGIPINGISIRITSKDIEEYLF